MLDIFLSFLSIFITRRVATCTIWISSKECNTFFTRNSYCRCMFSCKLL